MENYKDIRFGTCFLCFCEINEVCSEVPKINSVQNLLRYLKINQEEIKLLRSKVSLCKECETILERFSEHFQALELSRIKVEHNLKGIQEKLKMGPESLQNDQLEGIDNHSKTEELRLLIKTKCELKVNKSLPRVELQEEITGNETVHSIPVKTKTDTDPTPLKDSTSGLELVKSEPDPLEPDIGINEEDPLFQEEPEQDLFDQFFKSALRPLSPSQIEASKECPVCSKTFLDHKLMKTHLKTHSSVKPYQCSRCPKAYHSSWNLKRHVRTHTGERPYKCSVCGSAWAEKGNLNHHLRDVHDIAPTPMGIKRFQCNNCLKIFKRKLYVQRHLESRVCQMPVLPPVIKPVNLNVE